MIELEAKKNRLDMAYALGIVVGFVLMSPFAFARTMVWMFKSVFKSAAAIVIAGFGIAVWCAIFFVILRVVFGI